MTATPSGWLTDPRRVRQVNAVAAMIEAAPYKNIDPQWKWYSWPVGDCTNKSAWACEMLKTWGWPENVFERWACDLPDGRRHAVLCVNITDVAGDTTVLVVDCRYTTPQVKDALPYTDWCKIE